MKQDSDKDKLEQLSEPAKKRSKGEGLMDLLFITVPLLILTFGYHAFSNQFQPTNPAPLQRQPQTSNHEVPNWVMQKSQYDAKALDCGYHINEEIYRYRLQHKNDLSMPQFDNIIRQEWRGENCSNEYGFNTSYIENTPIDYIFNISHKSGSMIFRFNSSGLVKQ